MPGTLAEELTEQPKSETDDSTTKEVDAKTEEKEVKPENGLPGGDEETTEEKEGTKEKGSDLPGGETAEETTEEEEKKEGGAPEEYGAYDLSAGEAIGYTMDEERTKAYNQFGKENNFSKEQMDNILGLDIARRVEEGTANAKYIAEVKSEGINKSRQEYGEKYAGAHKKNAQVYDKFFPEDLKTKLNDYGISSDPHFFNMLNGFSKILSEDTMVPGDSVGADKSNRSLSQALTLKGERTE